jgi:RHS repeat-associated protein
MLYRSKLPRTTQVQKVLGGTRYTLKYAYNFAGELTSITYPSNRVVQQTFDGIGRASLISDGSSGNHFQDSFTYNPAFQTTSFNSGNGVAASMGYSVDRMQLQSITYAKGSSSLFGASYVRGGLGNNNGQITAITDTVDAGRTATYLYDALGRLTQAYTVGSTNYPKWDLKFAYDRYGNRLGQTVQSDTSPNLLPPAPGNSLSFANPGGAQTNRPDNMCFDASGNLLTETPANPCPPSAPMYTYDGENQLVDYVSALPTYVYDGNGFRVKKCLPNCTSPTSSTVYIFSGSKVIAEYDNGAATGSPSREYIYSGSRLLAKIDASGTKYYHQDHLSNRLVTDSSGNAIAQLGHYPFGESWYNSSNDKLLFTTYERDPESTNDYAIARYHFSRFGRFNSPDSFGGSPANPQSSNRYAYSLNSPTNLTDPSGRFVSFWGGSGGGGLLPGDSGGGGGFDCASDGIAVPCWLASAEISSGAGVQCPNNDCRLGTASPFQCVGSVCGYFSSQYVSTHENEWNGVLYSDGEWADFLTDRVESTREALADAISWASDNPNVTWDMAYNHLVYDSTKGANADFRWQSTLDNGDTVTLANLQLSMPGINTGGCEWSCREGRMPSLHFNNDMFHLDTANPTWGFGFGLFAHGLFDVVLGNINPSVPMVH